MADGDAVIQGGRQDINATQTTTELSNIKDVTSDDGAGMYVFGSVRGRGGLGLYAAGSGPGHPGIFAHGRDSHGVLGRAGDRGGDPGAAGVRGESEALFGVGVYGEHRIRVGVWGQGGIVGVGGQANTEFGIGVEGESSGDQGVGVYAQSTGPGSVGMYALAPPDGAAIQVDGRAVFRLSGRITVQANATSASQDVRGLSVSASILATVQQNIPNVSVRAAVPDPTLGRVTVHLSQATNVPVVVGWMAVN
ncbi:hypothetical protein [Geodermatophilus tzadiensis]|uniref:hypothetical protein n=1 Tax=Geodermatophilus tzadiensis TaxID=1137988 RepID=UPI0011B21DFD|nr:hypothetical protein [Geodermatophilus tzadiensis]